MHKLTAALISFRLQPLCDTGATCGDACVCPGATNKCVNDICVVRIAFAMQNCMAGMDC